MKIVLAGAFGKLGSDILRALCQTEHEIIAADAVVNVPGDLDESRFTTRKIDVTDPATLAGLCGGADVVITTVGLTGASTRFTNYDIDYQGNLNLLKEAEKAGVQHFAYISVINADKGEGIPMVHAKFRMEEELNGEATLVVTGGLAPVVLPYCRRKAIHAPDLVLEGLYRNWQLNR